jgi:hypothetical protein
MSCKSKYTYTIQAITKAVKLLREYSDCQHRVMMATLCPEIEPNCIPTAYGITQGNGECLINS